MGWTDYPAAFRVPAIATLPDTLGIDGGPPAVAPDLQRRWPEIEAGDRDALLQVLDRGELWGPNAPEVTALQEEWARYVGSQFCLMTNSGTAALHCALAAAGVRAGDEVIVPAFGFAATPMAVMHQGARPVFADIDPVTCALDPAAVEAAVGDRTRAILPVHAHGLPADMDELAAVAARHDLATVEDACQSHGALYRGRRVGTLGTAGAFSLNGSKNLSAGEGGLFVCDDPEGFVAARRLAIFGEDTPPLRAANEYRAYWSHRVGWNYRGHELTAVLARTQLRRLERHNAIAQRNADRLTAALTPLPGFEPPLVPEDRTSVHYRYRVRMDASALGYDGPAIELRDRILHALQGEGVPASLWQLWPLPAQPAFRPAGGYDPAAYPETVRLLESSFTLGTHVHPLFNQPDAAIDAYVRAFEKVLASIDRVLTGSYEPVRTVPPIGGSTA